VTHKASLPQSASVHLLDTDQAIGDAASAIVQFQQVALDTEFHAERRYHPELMLLQVCAPDGTTWLADPRACDVRPIIRAVSTRNVVVHAGQEDLAILHREADTAPQVLLDVQIGAGLMGLGYPTRLQDLCARLLDQPIDKASTLSDWSQRPLSKTQLQYAVTDVRVLLPLAQRIRAELENRGRVGWAEAASVEMATQATRPHTTRHSWSDWEIAPRMDAQTQATMKAIFEWRDARGRDKNQPPHFMLNDGLVLDLARRRPPTVQQLMGNRRVPGGLVRRYGEDLIRIIHQAQLEDLVPVAVPTLPQRQVANALEVWARVQADVTGIASKLAMPRAVALAIAAQGIEALTGWRSEALGEALNAFLDGEIGVYMGPDGPQLR